MKKRNIKYAYPHIFLLLFITVLLSGSIKLHGQKVKDVSVLIGTWTFNQGPSFAKIRSELNTQLDSTPEVKSQIISAYVGRKISFYVNGDYLQVLADGRSVSGTWVLDPSNLLSITSANGGVYQQQIIALSNGRLVIAPIVTGDNESIIPEWHFIKN